MSKIATPTTAPIMAPSLDLDADKPELVGLGLDGDPDVPEVGCNGPLRAGEEFGGKPAVVSNCGIAVESGPDPLLPCEAPLGDEVGCGLDEKSIDEDCDEREDRELDVPSVLEIFEVGVTVGVDVAVPCEDWTEMRLKGSVEASGGRLKPMLGLSARNPTIEKTPGWPAALGMVISVWPLVLPKLLTLASQSNV